MCAWEAQALAEDHAERLESSLEREERARPMAAEPSVRRNGRGSTFTLQLPRFTQTMAAPGSAPECVRVTVRLPEERLARVAAR